MNRLNLSNIKKCKQIWDDMKVVDGGRLCQKCQNVLIDFRGMSDDEIAFHHINSDKPVCGLYDDERLYGNPNFNIKPKRFKLNKLYLASAFGLLLNNQVKAENKSNINTEQTDILLSQNSNIEDNSNNTKENLKEDKYIFNGKFLNQYETPISGVIVSIKGDTVSYSDAFGNIELDLTEYFKNEKSITLIIKYINVKSINYLITKKDFDKLNNYTFRFYVENAFRPKIKYNQPSNSIHYGSGMDNGFAPSRWKPWYERLWDKIKKIF